MLDAVRKGSPSQWNAVASSDPADALRTFKRYRIMQQKNANKHPCSRTACAQPKREDGHLLGLVPRLGMYSARGRMLSLHLLEAEDDAPLAPHCFGHSSNTCFVALT